MRRYRFCSRDRRTMARVGRRFTPTPTPLVWGFTLALAASALLGVTSWASAAPSNTLTITNPSSATLTNDPMQLGRPFVQGEMLNFPQVVVNGTPLLTQADVKTRWPDGSVKHAILSFILPSLAANASATVTFQNQTSGNNTPLTPAQMLGSNFNFDAAIELTNGGTTVTASARQMLQDGNFTYWTSGPVATTVILADHSLNRIYDMGFDANRSFRPIIHATFWPTLNKVRVRFIGEIANTEALQDQVYDLTLKTGLAVPTTVYTKTAVTHTASSRWTKEFWIGGTPSTIAINHNLDYLKSTTLVPNYDTSKVVSQSAITSAYTSWTSAAKDLYGAGNWTKTMGNQGGRPDIGPYPAWTVRWLYTGDNRMREQTFGNADLSAAWPFHLREGNTTKFFDRAKTVPGIGKVMSISTRPSLCIGCGLNYAYTKAADKLVPVGPVTNGGWIAETAHQPEFASVQYMLSGDFWYLEEMWFWVAWSAAYPNGSATIYNYGRGPTGAEGGLTGNTRMQAWPLRNRVNTVVLTPDGSSEQAYMTTLINDVIAIWEGQRNITGTSFQGSANWNWGNTTGMSYWTTSTPNAGLPPLHHWRTGGPGFASNFPVDPTVSKEADSTWEQNYMMFTLGRAKELGFRADALVAWLAVNIIGQLTDPGYDPYLIATYRMPTIRLLDAKWFPTWADLKTGFDPTYNAQAKFNADLSNAEHGYSIIPIAAVSHIANEPGGAAAWTWIAQHALTAPSLNDNPKWAIIPRVVSAPPTSLPGDLDGNGTVDVLDLQQLVNVLLGTQTTPAIITRADLNGDGSPTILDLQLLVNLLLGVP